MDFEKIQYFIKVCELKNLTKAAEELYISQPTLSRHILTLESELGVTLLIRKRSGVELTEAGKIFLADAKNFQEAEKNLTTNIFRYKNKYSQNINVGIDHASELKMAYYAINAFKKILPEISIDCHILSTEELLNQYLSKTIDVAYGYRNHFPDVYDSTLITVMQNYPVLKVPQGHRLYNEKDILIHDIIDEILFLPSKRNDPLAEAALQAFEKHNIKLKKAVFFDNWYDCYFQAALDCRLSVGGRFGFEKNLDLNPLFRHHSLSELNIDTADLCAIYRTDNTFACRFAGQLQITGKKHSDHYLNY